MSENYLLPGSLVELNLPPAARSILREALSRATAQGAQVTDNAVADYVSLAPAADHTVAVYVHRGEMSIALDQDVARRTTRAYPELELEVRGPGAAGYVRADYEVIDRQGLRNVVIDLVLEAFSRSAALGPREFGRRGARHVAGTVVETCPVHHMALPASGICDLCD